MTLQKWLMALVLAGVVGLTGCKTTSSEEGGSESTQVEQTLDDSAGGSGLDDQDGVDDVPADPVVTGETVFEAGNITVYFEYDSSTLSFESKMALDGIAEGLLNDSMTILVEGHTDERGTRSYNQALGERRALAVREYLVLKGVDAGRVSIVSHGEERPAALGSDESAWSQNRRAEISPQ